MWKPLATLTVTAALLAFSTVALAAGTVPVSVRLSTGRTVQAGQSAAAMVKSLPNIRCRGYYAIQGKADVVRANIPYPGKTDENGYLAFTVTIPSTTPAGVGVVVVHCEKRGQAPGVGFATFKTTSASGG